MLLVPLAEELCAVPLDRARRVVPLPDVTPVSRAPSSLIGISLLDGEAVPVFDPAALLGLGPGGPFTHLVVLDTPRGAGGVATTGMPRWVELGARIGVSELPAGRGRFEAGLRVATVLDVDALLGPSTIGD
jgi:chemotaxis signal transduction protein